MLKKTVPIVAAVALAATGALVAGSPADASRANQATKLTATAYALQASGYGSRVKGGDVPAGSDRSAFQIIGCTNKAGISKSNTEANVNLGQGEVLSGLRTTVSTTKRGGTVSSSARHSIAKVTLGKLGPGQTDAGTVALRGVVSTSRTWHDGRGFHASTRASIAKITLNPLAGPSVDIPVPTNNQPINIGGLVSLSLGAGNRHHDGRGATASLDAVRLKVLTTGTVSYLAHSRSSIRGGVTGGLYNGSAYATKANLLKGTVSSGRTPNLVMPCVGTNNKVRNRSIAHLRLGDGIRAGALSASEKAGTNSQGRPQAYERSRIGNINLRQGLVIKAVSGQANVRATAHGYRTSTAGTTPGKVYLNGTRRQFNSKGVIRIAGVARIDSHLVSRSKGSIRVIAVQVTLLNSTRTGVVNLGYAKVGLRSSGR